MLKKKSRQQAADDTKLLADYLSNEAVDSIQGGSCEKQCENKAGVWRGRGVKLWKIYAIFLHEINKKLEFRLFRLKKKIFKTN